MVRDWRAKTGNARLFFTFVMLAPFTGPSGSGWADVRAAQLAVLALPDTAMASAVDIGDASSPYGAYHPRNKALVGARLAAAAMDGLYGVPTPWRGPAFAGASVAPGAGGGGGLAITLEFEPRSLGGGGLALYPARNNSVCPPGVDPDICEDFVVLATPGDSPVPPTFAYAGAGYISAGGDIPGGGNMTLAQGEAACVAEPRCVGLTFASNSSSCADRAGGVCDILLKSSFDFNADAQWQAYRALGRRGDGLVKLAVSSVAVSADGRAVVVATAAPAAGQAVRAVSYAYSTWPLTPLYNLAGLPAVPFFTNVSASA
jgi:hypothetical protein